MALSTEEIQRIIEKFEEMLQATTIANNGQPAGCKVCRFWNRRAVNSQILHGNLRDGTIAKNFGFDRATVVHHKFHCLPRFGGATFSALERYNAHREKLFPINGSITAQKRFILDELLFLRDEALKKNPIDRKEILKLTKEISVASAEYRSAREEDLKRRRDRRAKEKEQRDDGLDLTPEQREQMKQVGGTNVQ